MIQPEDLSGVDCIVCLEPLILIDPSFAMPLFSCGSCKRTSCHMVCVMEWFHHKMTCPHCGEYLHYSHTRPVVNVSRSESSLSSSLSLSLSLSQRHQIETNRSAQYRAFYIDNFFTRSRVHQLPVTTPITIKIMIMREDVRVVFCRFKVVSFAMVMYAVASLVSYWAMAPHPE
jgi:hypothetical protein